MVVKAVNRFAQHSERTQVRASAFGAVKVPLTLATSPSRFAFSLSDLRFALFLTLYRQPNVDERMCGGVRGVGVWCCAIDHFVFKSFQYCTKKKKKGKRTLFQEDDDCFYLFIMVFVFVSLSRLFLFYFMGEHGVSPLFFPPFPFLCAWCSKQVRASLSLFLCLPATVCVCAALCAPFVPLFFQPTSSLIRDCELHGTFLFHFSLLLPSLACLPLAALT